MTIHNDMLVALAHTEKLLDSLHDGAMRHDRRRKARQLTRQHAIEDWEKATRLLAELEAAIKDLRGESLAREMLGAIDDDRDYEPFAPVDPDDYNVEEVRRMGRFENGRVVSAKMLPNGEWSDGAIWGGPGIGWTTDFEQVDPDEATDITDVFDSVIHDTVNDSVDASKLRHPSASDRRPLFGVGGTLGSFLDD